MIFDPRGIYWELSIPGYPQMNGTAERLGQTLYKKASTMPKNSGISMFYWLKLIQNRQLFAKSTA